MDQDLHEYALSCVGVLLYRRSYLAKNVVSCRDHWIRVGDAKESNQIIGCPLIDLVAPLHIIKTRYVVR